MIRYFDASAVVKRYVREPGSSTVRRLLAAGTSATSRLSQVEVASAIARRAREGAFAASRRDRILAALDGDLSALAVVEMIPAITAEARASSCGTRCAPATPSSLQLSLPATRAARTGSLCRLR